MGLGIRTLRYAGGIAAGYAAAFGIDNYDFFMKNKDKVIKRTET